MTGDQIKEYNQIVEAIKYLTINPKVNVSLDELANFMTMDPKALQKLFVHWCGISPKQFQRYLSLEYARDLLKQGKTSFQTAVISGLSSGGRLHDLFVDIVGMTPGECKNGGNSSVIKYSIHDSRFGYYLVASTNIGICNVLFLENPDLAQAVLKSYWPKADLIELFQESHKPVVDFFSGMSPSSKIKLHLHGTNYQLQVWQALLSIPEGRVTTYGNIAKQVSKDKIDIGGLASRAVGSAIGSNPVGYLIPCHRVLKSTGHISGYRWGVGRKQAILAFEASKINELQKS